MKPKLGRPPVFKTDEQLKMHRFLLECWFMGIPRSRNAFAMDIKFKVDKEQLKVPFAKGIPGNDFTSQQQRLI